MIGAFIFYKLLKTKYGIGKNAVGRIRKNVIAYSVALIQKYLLQSQKSLDLQSIWRNNGVDISETKIKDFLIYINQLLLQNLDDGRLDEACKKKDSWDKILTKVDWRKIESLVELLPICEKRKFKKTSSSDFDVNSKYKLMVDEINKMIHSAAKYEILHKRIQNEIEMYRQDGMSLYSRRHLRLMQDHFRPNTKLTDYDPMTYNLYLVQCQNKNGEIIKKKFLELKNKLDDLYRVFNAIMKDELLEFE